MSLPQTPYVFTPKTLCLHPLLHITAALLPFLHRRQPPFLDYFINQTHVGYNTVTIQPGYNMLSVNFKDINNTEGIGIQELFLGGGNAACPFTGNTASTLADQIQVFVNDGVNADYVSYYLYKNSKTSTDPKNNYWCNSANAIEKDKKFNNGDTLWFRSRAKVPVTFSISGEVELSDVRTVTINKGYNMIGSFFPAGWAVNDEPYTTDYWKNAGATGNTASTMADQIQVYVNNGVDTPDYTTYYLYNNSKSTTDPKNWKWCNSANAAVKGNILPAGQGAWYLNRGTKAASFTLDIKKQF